MAARKPIPPTIYTGTFADSPQPTSLHIRENVCVCVDTTGTIRWLGHRDQLPLTLLDFDVPSARRITLLTDRTCFFYPGFIDTHTHAPQYPNTGIFGNSTLLSWLEKYTYPMESSFKDLERAKRVYNRVVERTLANGTTCAAYYATLHVPATNLLADICLERGQRALIGRVCMDRMSPDGYRDKSVEEAVKGTRAAVDHCREIDPRGEIVRPIVTPRFAPSCTTGCMNALGKMHLEEKLWCQTHTSENKAELELVKELFPNNKDYLSVYDQHGLLSERTILAHAIHLSEDEVALIKQRRSKVSHCPTSNTALTSGVARVKELMKSGVTVSLGTDMSGGYSPSIKEIAKSALLASRYLAMDHGDEHKLNDTEALYLATMGGAEAVGLADKVGTFEVGKQFDAQLIVLDDVDEGGEVSEPSAGQSDIWGWEQNWATKIYEWLWTGDDRNVAAVYVDGRQVHNNARVSDLLAP